jgi:hypothetical protein
MDDKSNQLLQEILNQQIRQTELLRRNLVRMRFSMLGLILFMTLISVVLGFGVYTIRRTARPVTIPATPSRPAPPSTPGPFFGPASPVFPAPNTPYEHYQTPPNKANTDPVG